MMEYIKLAMLVVGENVRLTFRDKVREREYHEIFSLADDIAQHHGVAKANGVTDPCGLKTPLTVNKIMEGENKGKYLVRAGHRRTDALHVLMERDPKAFKAMFPKGIPVYVSTDTTEDLLVDHGNERPLNSKFELQKCANKLFSRGATDKEVAVSLNPLMERIVNPLSGERLKTVKGLRAELAEAKANGVVSKVEAIEASIQKEIAEARHGYVQYLKDVYRCPAVVMASEMAKATGENPEGFDNQVLPQLTNKQVNGLAKALAEDKDIDGANHSRLNPGPHFNKLWNELVEKASKPRKATAPRKKAMASKDITALQGELCSKGMKELCTKVSDASARIDVSQADEDLYTIELIKAHEPEMWAAVLKKRASIEALLASATKEG